VGWQGLELQDIFVADRKEFHAVGVHLVADVGDGRSDGVQFARLDLDGDLPQGDEGENEPILTKYFDGLTRTAWIGFEVSDEGVGIDQNPHLDFGFGLGCG
jgi:hypothetical protein